MGSNTELKTWDKTDMSTSNFSLSVCLLHMLRVSGNSIPWSEMLTLSIKSFWQWRAPRLSSNWAGSPWATCWKDVEFRPCCCRCLGRGCWVLLLGSSCTTLVTNFSLQFYICLLLYFTAIQIFICFFSFKKTVPDTFLLSLNWPVPCHGEFSDLINSGNFLSMKTCMEALLVKSV